MPMATAMFPLKASTPCKGKILPHHLWPKSVLHDIHVIHHRAKALRRFAKLVAMTSVSREEPPSNAESPHHNLWTRVSNPLTLKTTTSPPIRNLEALSLSYTLDEGDDSTPEPDLQSRINACFKAHRRTTRLLLKHARNQRRLKYGKALLRMFIKNPKVALQSILRTVARRGDSQPLPTNLSIIRDDTSGCLVTDPKEVVKQVHKLETTDLSTGPTLPPGAPFPWLSHITPNLLHTVPMISR